jgi:hypothetical protein
LNYKATDIFNEINEIPVDTGAAGKEILFFSPVGNF